MPHIKNKSFFHHRRKEVTAALQYESTTVAHKHLATQFSTLLTNDVHTVTLINKQGWEQVPLLTGTQQKQGRYQGWLHLSFSVVISSKVE